MSECMTDITPTDLEITQSTVPVGINVGAQAQRNYSRAGADQIERGGGQDQAQTGQCLHVADFSRLPLKAGGLIIQEVFFQVKAQTMLIASVHIGRIVAE